MSCRAKVRVTSWFSLLSHTGITSSLLAVIHIQHWVRCAVALNGVHCVTDLLLHQPEEDQLLTHRCLTST